MLACIYLRDNAYKNDAWVISFKIVPNGKDFFYIFLILPDFLIYFFLQIELLRFLKFSIMFIMIRLIACRIGISNHNSICYIYDSFNVNIWLPFLIFNFRYEDLFAFAYRRPSQDLDNSNTNDTVACIQYIRGDRSKGCQIYHFHLRDKVYKNYFWVISF